MTRYAHATGRGSVEARGERGGLRGWMRAGLVALAMVLPMGAALAVPASPVHDGVTTITGQTFDKTSFFMGNNLHISECVIDGTAFVFGNDIDFDADVNGDLVVFGNDVTIGGNVSGSVVSAAQRIDLLATVEREVYGACATFLLDRTASAARDLFVAASTVKLNGAVGRDAYVGAGSLTLDGPIGGDASLACDSIAATVDASVQGAVAYWSERSGDLGGNPDIAGKAQWQQVHTRERSTGSRVAGKVLGLGSTLVFALVLYALSLLMSAKTKARATGFVVEKPLRTFGLGLGFTALTPMVALLVMLTVILMPASFLTLALWGLALCCTTATCAYVVMDALSGRLGLHAAGWRVLGFAVAVIALELLMMVPFVGVVVRIATIFLGMGVLFSMVFLRPRANDGIATA